jgi:DNA-binding NarL/FixJ family response regulator
MTAPEDNAPIRVLVADDQALIRAGLVALFRSAAGLEIVGEAGDGAEALARTAEARPDVVLMDIRMPVLDGIVATREILNGSGGHRPRIVVMTAFDLDEYVYAALLAGASGFLLKDTPPARIIMAVRTIAAGDVLLAPRITRRLIEAYSGHRRAIAADAERLGTLTIRETEVLRLIGAGLSNAEIAERLRLSEATVKTHLKNLMSKLGLNSRAQAVVLAYESGLIVPNPPR